MFGGSAEDAAGTGLSPMRFFFVPRPKGGTYEKERKETAGAREEAERFTEKSDRKEAEKSETEAVRKEAGRPTGTETVPSDQGQAVPFPV